MKTSSILAGFLGAVLISIICPYVAASESGSALVHPASVQLLGKLPSGEMFLFDGQKLFQFTGTYKRVGVIAATSSVGKKDGKWPSDEPNRFVNIYRSWPDLQRKAAALGANAVIITGEDIDHEGFERSHGSPGIMETIGIIVADAVIFQGATKVELELPPALSIARALPDTPTFASAVSKMGPEFAAIFPHPIQIKTMPHTPGLPAGDAIIITSMKGDRSHVAVGGFYLIQGEYQLTSSDEATLKVSVAGWRGGIPAQRISVHRGKGTFSLALPIRHEGPLHAAFYPIDQGKPLGGVYFAEK